jgi:UDP-apiose/xylose synthase
MRRIVLLGAGGFLGSHLTAALARRPALTLRAVDTTFAKLDPMPPQVEAIEGTVTDAGLIRALVDESDLVVSMTALCNPALYNTRPVEVIHASFSDLVPLVEACARAQRRLVHFSTCEVYGRHLPPAGEALDEEQSPFSLGPLSRERWTYACAKQLLERLIVGHRQLPFTIVRPFNVIGPRMDFIAGVDGEGAPRVLACLMRALMLGQPLPLVNGGAQRRAFIAVEDFTEAVMRIIDRPEATHRQVFNHRVHPGHHLLRPGV